MMPGGCRCSACTSTCGRPIRRPSSPGARRGSTRASGSTDALGLDASREVASDPFFGRGGKLLAVSQRDQRPQARDRRADRQRRAADRDHLAQLPPGSLRPALRHHAPPTARSRTPRASASAWSGSRSRSIAATASTAPRWPSAVREALGPVMQRLWPLDPADLRAASASLTASAPGPSRIATSISGSSCCTPRALEPLAALPFTFAIDLEGDQWTFFKFPLADLVRALRRRGDRAERLAPARRPRRRSSWPSAAVDRRGRRVLPARHRRHVLSRRARQDVDRDPGARRRRAPARLLSQRRLLRARRRRLRAGLPPRRAHSPIPTTCRRMWRSRSCRHACRRSRAGRSSTASLDLLRTHLARRPHDEPVSPLRRSASPPTWMARAGEPLARFHSYAFATLRQCGAAFELAGAYLRWLAGARRDAGSTSRAVACDVIADDRQGAAVQDGARASDASVPSTRRRCSRRWPARWDETMTALDAHGTARSRISG